MGLRSDRHHNAAADKGCGVPERRWEWETLIVGHQDRDHLGYHGSKTIRRQEGYLVLFGPLQKAIEREGAERAGGDSLHYSHPQWLLTLPRV